MAATRDTMRHWNALGRTDPSATKSFQRPGGFRGTATKPIWNEMRLTEHFGPCGIGWGFSKPEFQVVPANEGQQLIICVVRGWYADDDGQQAEVWGVGGDTAVKKTSSGLYSDDESFKKAFTDALGNAFKHVGVNADIHLGMFEDNKYVEEQRRAFAQERQEGPQTRETARGYSGSGNGASPTHAPPASAEQPSTAKMEAVRLYNAMVKAIEDARTHEALDEAGSTARFAEVEAALKAAETPEVAEQRIKALDRRFLLRRDIIAGGPG